MNQQWEQLKTWWEALEPGARRQLQVAAALSLALLIAVGWWSSATNWRTLVSHRSYDELLQSAAALDEAGVTYRISEQGTLDVPANSLGSARSALGSGQSLPSLEDVGELKLGLTPRAQEWAFMRAREGDIARMLGGIDGVSAAQVNVVPRQETLFLEEAEPASASVFLKMAPGSRMSDSQVRAMVSLVSNAVEGLDADHVSVTDDSGSVLALGDGGVGHDAPGELLEYRTRMQRNYERAVRQALLPVLGGGADFSVTAQVELDLNSTDVTTRTIDTDKQAVLSEQMDESSSEKSGASGGAPGVDANLPERSTAPGAKGQNAERLAATTNYMYPTVDEVQHRPAGGLRRLSVAVQVNQARIAALAGEEAGAVEELQKQIAEAVRTAVGADEARGDQVSIHFMPFAETNWVEPSPSVTGFAAVDSFDGLARTAVAALALVLTFWLVIRPLIQSATGQTPAAADADPEEEAVAEKKADDLGARLHALVENFEKVDSKDLSVLVERNATAAAQVLRRWNVT